jgi:hypothetical protein
LWIKQRRHIGEKLYSKDKFELLTVQQIFIFPLSVAAQFGTISKGIAIFSSHKNYGQKQRRHIAGKLCGKDKCETLIFKQSILSFLLLLQPTQVKGLFFNEFILLPALQRNFDLCITRKEIARPKSQFPHSCVCERSTYDPTFGPPIFLQHNRETDQGNI